MKIVVVTLALASVTFAKDSEVNGSNYDDKEADGLRQARSMTMDLINQSLEKLSQQNYWQTDVHIQPVYSKYPLWSDVSIKPTVLPSGSVSIVPEHSNENVHVAPVPNGLPSGSVQWLTGDRPNQFPGGSVHWLPGDRPNQFPSGSVHWLPDGKPFHLPGASVTIMQGGKPSQLSGGSVSFVSGGIPSQLHEGGVSFVPGAQSFKIPSGSITLEPGKPRLNLATPQKDISVKFESSKHQMVRSAEDRRIEQCSQLSCATQQASYPVCACNFVTGKVASFKEHCDVQKHNCRFETDFQVILPEICPWEFDSRRSMSNLPDFDYSSDIYYNN